MKKTSKKKLTPKQRGIIEGYRSGLEELNVNWLKQLGVQVEYEPYKLQYVIPSRIHLYTPDFILPNGIIIETKGRFITKDRQKHLLLKAQYPDLDIRLVFSNPNNRLYKGSPTTYAAWAEKNGFVWAKQLIPKAWIDEPYSETRWKAIKEAMKR